MDPITIGLGIMALAAVLGGKKALPHVAPAVTLTKKQLAWVQKIEATATPMLIEQELTPFIGICLAQAALESGYGSSMPDNPFGKRGVGDAGSNYITTQESSGVGDGSTVAMTDQKFAKYSTQAAAVQGWINWCTSQRNGYGFATFAQEPELALIWIWGACTYATADNYVGKIVSVSHTVSKNLGLPMARLDLSDDQIDLVKQLSVLTAKQRVSVTQDALGPNA